MSIVALLGDCTTTTAVAMSSSWPSADDVVIVEADRSGGSLAGWLDTPATPSLSTIVANSHTLDTSPSAAWFALDAMVKRSASGVRFIAAPIRAREASRAVGEASIALFPLLASLAEPTFIVDCGRFSAADSIPATASLAAAVVVVHRQSAASAAAESVRLERLAETIGVVAPLGVPVHVAIIGDRPFGLAEIEGFISNGGSHKLTIHGLADDSLTAAVFAGRTGVSPRRLGRLPLMRDSRALTGAVRSDIGADGEAAWLDQLGSRP